MCPYAALYSSHTLLAALSNGRPARGRADVSEQMTIIRHTSIPLPSDRSDVVLVRTSCSARRMSGSLTKTVLVLKSRSSYSKASQSHAACDTWRLKHTRPQPAPRGLVGAEYWRRAVVHDRPSVRSSIAIIDTRRSAPCTWIIQVDVD